MPRPKRAGRPRLDASNAILPDDRRTQVRRAQRTYRQKKETVFQNAIARAQQLEARMRAAVQEVTRLSEAAATAQLHLSHPDLSARLKRLDGLLLTDGHRAIETGSSSPAEPSLDSPGGSVLKVQADPPLHSPLPTGEHTYAFQETRFARRLQRYSLEHAYRLFTERQADPREIYRVFRLVPCVQDREKTQPRFLQLVTGGRTDPLEVPGLPFYCVGGAGTHFPDVDGERNAVYPVNRRMPRRVLGLLPWAELGGQDSQALEAYGLGGEWFDSRDVEGYLRLHGVDVDGGLFPMLHLSSGGIEGHVLDVEGFFSRLLSGLVILGRAPGFKKTEVRRAFQASVRMVGGI